MYGLLVLFGSLSVLIVVGVPIAISLGLASLATILFLGLNPQLLTEHMFEGLNSYTLMAAPFFLILGQMMNYTQITERLMNFADALVGHIRGGILQVDCMTSMLFAGMSGTATADVAASGSILMPAQVKRGYDINFAIALTATTATIGVIIPPSITMIIYGSVGRVSIGALFLSGVIPGIMLTVALMFYCYYYSVKIGMKGRPRSPLSTVFRAVKGAFIPLWIPVLLVGGVVSGQVTATESGVLGIALAMFLGLVVYRTMQLKSMPAILKDAAITYSLPLFAFASAMAFGWLLAYLRVPIYIGEMLGPVAENPRSMILFLLLVVVILGTFLDAIAAIIIMMPIIEHLIDISGANPTHTGLVVIMTLALGHITPPFGLALFLSCAIMRHPVLNVIPALVPFYVVYLAVVVFIAMFPSITLLLPRYVFGPMVG